MAISCDKNQLSTVVNGQKVFDVKFEDKGCPTSLVGKLVLLKALIVTRTWIQGRGRVANVNVFSGLMSQDRMVSMTSGEECGKQNGDLLSWANSSWSLQGAATKWMDVPVEDLCMKFSSIQFFSTGGVTEPGDCRRLCKRMQQNGRMTSVETTDQFVTLKARLKSIPNTGSRVIWLPITRQNDIWVDIYTKREISMNEWNTGYPGEASDQTCAIWPVVSGGYLSYKCESKGGQGGWYCSCHFAEQPYLTMRGQCKDSNLDKTYLPQNEPLDGETTFYGTAKTIARYLRDDNQWRMKSNHYNTTALSKEISGRFMLGKQTWTVEGDSKKCFDGKAYTAVLKLTGCKAGQFTCDDGACVLMAERCNQVSDCRDESDENGCRLIVLKDNYNKNIPPIARANDGGSIPAQVGISIDLMKVVEIEEVAHSIHLQIQIKMQWRENRVKYQNLKAKTSLNALTADDIGKLWLPQVVYDNTDQKQTTRLGEYGNGEWVTRVAVVKEGNFTRSTTDEVDEAEIFEGAENTLMMTQTYTLQFQCKYNLKKYPFDTQVKHCKDCHLFF